MGINNKKLTTEEFIGRANQVHNNKYDYSKCIYINSTSKVEIICSKHGSFYQEPPSHTHAKQGCPKCSRENRAKKQVKSFDYARANKIHNNKYDYSKVMYTRTFDKVEIICPLHGSFFQAPKNHINFKQGCIKCAYIEQVKRNTKGFDFKLANKVHLCKYDYSRVKYKRRDQKVEIICPKHGSFWQSPNDHYQYGCNQCGCEVTGNKKRGSFDCNLANKTHNNRYDYSRVRYFRRDRKVEIICPKHGSFWQTPDSHIYSGSGCKSCTTSVSHKGDRWLQSLAIPTLQKEVTIRVGRKRYKADGFDPTTNVIYEYLGVYWHGNPYIYNPHDINPSTKKTFGELYLKTIDRIRDLEDAGYKVVWMWGA